MNCYQIILPIFTIVFLIQVFVIQSWIQWKKTGIKPYVFGKTESPHDYCGRVYKLMIVGTWISIVFYSFFYSYYKLLLPIWFIEKSWLQHLGFGLLIVSFGWIIIAQRQMSTSWRIGINYSEKTRLMNSGLFGISRNPIFLGVMVSYVGTFFIIPNALSFAILFVTYVTLQIQVRLEEEYLKKTHGSKYSDYYNSVRRWI